MTLNEQYAKQIPLFEKRVGCIADDPKLAAIISSFFNEKGTYFATFYAPRLWQQFDPGRKAKAIRMLDPDMVILAGLKPNEEQAMREKLKDYRIITIRKPWQIRWKLWFLRKKFSGELRCKQTDIALGLLHAKRKNLMLIPDENAADLSLDLSGGTNLFVLEAEGDLSDVITANYAFAFGAGLISLRCVSKDLAHTIQSALSHIGNSLAKDPEKAKKILQGIEKKISALGTVNLDGYESATFITWGVPYSLYYRDHCPICHIFRYPDLGRFLFNNIWSEQFHSFLGLGMVFAPERFNKNGSFDEVDFVLKKLSADCHYYAIILEEEKATVQALEDFIHFFPMELLHISAHGGEGEGYRCKYEFDYEGKMHEIVVDEVITAKPQLAKPDKDGRVRVGSKYVFKRATFDGIPWKQSDFKKFPAELRFSVMRNTKPERQRIDYVPNSNQIFCHDGASLGTYQATGLNPVVFNNSCSSISELASSFIFAGARCYIGTCWPVWSPDPAAYVACAFYEKIMEKPLLNSFWEAMALHPNQKDPLGWKNYLFFGTHFSTLRPTKVRPSDPLKPILQKKIASWKARAEQPDISKEWKKECERVAEFLTEQLSQFDKAIDQMQPTIKLIMPICNIMLDARGELIQHQEFDEILGHDLLETTNLLIGILQYI